MPDRSVRRVLTDVIDARAAGSDTPEGAMSLRFPSTRWIGCSLGCFWKPSESFRAMKGCSVFMFRERTTSES